MLMPKPCSGDFKWILSGISSRTRLTISWDNSFGNRPKTVPTNKSPLIWRDVDAVWQEVGVASGRARLVAVVVEDSTLLEMGPVCELYPFHVPEPVVARDVELVLAYRHEVVHASRNKTREPCRFTDDNNLAILSFSHHLIRITQV